MVTDYCTSWPDGIPTWLGGTGVEWSHCCAAHDEFYAGYDGWFGYLGAHWELCQCVASAGFTGMGVIMLAGLVTFGSLLIVNRKNKYKPGSKKDR
jgi:hypothetical protein